MARSRKKTISQKIVGTATTGMPTPIKKLVGGRVVAFLIVASMALLLITGVVKIHWENGRPRFSINEQRAAEVKAVVKDEVDHLKVGRDCAARTNEPPVQGFGQQESQPSFRPLSTFRSDRDSQRR